MTKAAHTVATNVLKYMRWRHTDEHGDVAAGCTGVVLHVADRGAYPVDVCPWAAACHGHVGHWSVDMCHMYLRYSANEWTPEDEARLHGRTIVAVGFRSCWHMGSFAGHVSGSVRFLHINSTCVGGGQRAVHVCAFFLWCTMERI